jgi:hypothetical protein
VQVGPERSGPLGRRLRITAPGVSLPTLLLGGRADLRRDAAEVITALAGVLGGLIASRPAPG